MSTTNVNNIDSILTNGHDDNGNESCDSFVLSSNKIEHPFGMIQSKVVSYQMTKN